MVTAFVRQGGFEAGLPEQSLGELDLMIEEIFINLCRYAYPGNSPGDVVITHASPAPGSLAVEVADHGIEFNPLAAADPDLTRDLRDWSIGGLGILLVKSLAKPLSYRREQGWNRLTFGISASQ